VQQESLVLDQPTGPEVYDDGVIADRRTRETRRHFQECPVCFGQHEEQIHEATLSIRQWFRGEVTKGFDVVFFE